MIDATEGSEAVAVEGLRESLKMKMEKVADRLGITLEEACERAIASFCKEGC